MRPAHTARTVRLLALGLVLGGLLAVNPPACAEGAQETLAELHALAERAAVIFSGQVTAVRRIPAQGAEQDPSSGAVEIDFAVDDAIRGLPAHAHAYTVREWAGLWSNGAEPFRVGQRYLLLLHAPGRAGLSSPVGGDDGAIPILAAAPAASAQAGSAQGDPVPAPPSERVADLRWVAARALRSARPQAAQTVRPAAQSTVESAVQSTVEPAVQASLQPGADSAPAASLRAVLIRLHDWQKADHAAR